MILKIIVDGCGNETYPTDRGWEELYRCYNRLKELSNKETELTESEENEYNQLVGYNVDELEIVAKTVDSNYTPVDKYTQKQKDREAIEAKFRKQLSNKFNTRDIEILLEGGYVTVGGKEYTLLGFGEEKELVEV